MIKAARDVHLTTSLTVRLGQCTMIGISLTYSAGRSARRPRAIRPSSRFAFLSRTATLGPPRSTSPSLVLVILEPIRCRSSFDTAANLQMRSELQGSGRTSDEPESRMRALPARRLRYRRIPCDAYVMLAPQHASYYQFDSAGLRADVPTA